MMTIQQVCRNGNDDIREDHDKKNWHEPSWYLPRFPLTLKQFYEKLFMGYFSTPYCIVRRAFHLALQSPLICAADWQDGLKKLKTLWLTTKLWLCCQSYRLFTSLLVNIFSDWQWFKSSLSTHNQAHWNRPSKSFISRREEFSLCYLLYCQSGSMAMVGFTNVPSRLWVWVSPYHRVIIRLFA